MGAELGELYTELSQELTWQYWRWRQFVALYAGSEARIEILNSAAPFFFWIAQETLWHDALLGLSRIGGPAATGKKQNLSVHQLPGLIADPELQQRVSSLLADVSEAVAFAMDWRNRHIAHRDLDLSLGRAAKPLADASRRQVDDALDTLARVLNTVQRYYLQSETGYRFSPGSRDAEDLLYVLRDGIRLERLRQQRLEEGEYRPEEWGDDDPAL
jgi:hypothetical protein